MADDTLKFAFWAILAVSLDKYGKGRHGVLASRMTKNKPNTASNEVTVKVVINVPGDLFTKPELSAVITVPPSTDPVQVDTDVVSGLAGIIEKEMGLKVSVSFPEEE